MIEQRASRRPRRLTPMVLAGAVLTAVLTPIASIGSTAVQAVDNNDWLGVVNTYRAMSGLDPVAENSSWSAEAAAHSCYMLYNGITHYETAGATGYTAGGAEAGSHGNVAVSSSISATPRNHIDLWMTGPFHAIGILRNNLRTTGFGGCALPSTPTWHSGATLDVVRGLDSTPRPANPIVFPGNGATVPLSTFVTESPNPLTMCNWTGAAGLPLLALMPADVTTADATLTGPSGPIQTCVLHKGNVSDATAKSILDGDNAIVIMPRDPLADGTYTATVNSNGGNVTWSFTVNRSAPLSVQAPPPPPEPTQSAPVTAAARYEPVTPFRFVDSRIGLRSGRLPARTIVPIQVTTDPDVLAVSANFVSTNSAGTGYLTTFNCTSDRPEVSTLNFRQGDVVANQSFVPLSQGNMCLYALTDTDVVIDINGYYRRATGGGFTPITPVRLYDTREYPNSRLPAGDVRSLTISGVSPGAPSDATAVILNLTAINPDWYGWLRVFPCGSQAGNEISSINFIPGEVRANSVVVPIAAGTVCLQSSTGLDVALDLFGYYTSGGGYDFQPLSPVRIFDSRLPQSELNQETGGMPLAAGRTVRLHIAGRQGVPAGATAAAVNITTVSVGSSTFVTAFPCGDRPLASNVNVSPWQAVTANGAMVKLSPEGDLCLYTPYEVHVVVDINGVWL